MPFTLVNPESLGAPSGYANGLLADANAKLLFISGQVAWNEKQKIVSQDFVEQFDRALANVMAVVNAADGKPEHIARFVIYVTSKGEYLANLREVGERYRKHLGKHFPAMTLVEVSALLDDEAKVEIEGIALIPA